ncbi:MAG TPA: flagellar export protein FliJ [Candidatus Saccharimonadales bacterium]|nr:flagellar export protein FliJ [Candidatus Saccharimonadales bacterium]
MKTFHFTLEAVRTLRQRQEQNAMEQYAQSLLARQQAMDRLAAVEHELSLCWEELRGHLAKGCVASKAAQAHDYQRSLARSRDELAAALGAAERRVNAALQCMLIARQQREIVDKCSDKQKALHQHGVARGEQKFMDDLGGRRNNAILAWKPAQNLS